MMIPENELYEALDKVTRGLWAFMSVATTETYAPSFKPPLETRPRTVLSAFDHRLVRFTHWRLEPKLGAFFAFFVVTMTADHEKRRIEIIPQQSTESVGVDQLIREVKRLRDMALSGELQFEREQTLYVFSNKKILDALWQARKEERDEFLSAVSPEVAH